MDTSHVLLCSFCFLRLLLCPPLHQVTPYLASPWPLPLWSLGRAWSGPLFSSRVLSVLVTPWVYVVQKGWPCPSPSSQWLVLYRHSGCSVFSLGLARQQSWVPEKNAVLLSTPHQLTLLPGRVLRQINPWCAQATSVPHVLILRMQGEDGPQAAPPRSTWQTNWDS